MMELLTNLLKITVVIVMAGLEYGHPAGAQVAIRAEAFMEMLESRAS
jgi:hypothetical protein